MRTTTDLTGTWRFILDDPENACNDTFDDSEWIEVTVPHDWAVGRPVSKDTPGGPSQGFYQRWGIGWYRKEILMDPDPAETFTLAFDGVFHESDVYVNGHHVGHKHYGYTPFSYDISDEVISGKNTIAVRVDNSVEHSADRWYSGCGIYRPVTLIANSNKHIKQFGVQIAAEDVTEERCTLAICICTVGATDGPLHLNIEVLDANGNERASSSSAATGTDTSIEIELPKPKLWSPETPHMYIAAVHLIAEGTEVDRVDQSFGVRTVELNADEGLFLNGRNVVLKGVNLHHDLGITGAAWNRALAERRLRKLKSIGCNAIRTSHNPPAAEFLDLCDEIGFWVIDEAFDKWQSMRYGLIFDSCWKEDIDAMVTRDFNHPCIFAWSVGNEIDNQGEPEMLKTLELLTARVKQQDSSRLVTFAQHPHAWPERVNEMSVQEKAERTTAMAELVDFASLNYQEQWYEAYRSKKTDILIAGSETYMYFRGTGNSFASYRAENPYLSVVEHPYVFGHFVWAGVDYLGEAVWPARGWPGCLMDTNAELREAGQLTRILWEEKPAVFMAIADPTMRNQHGNFPWCAPGMAGHWNFEHLPARILEVAVFTTCEEVELYLNGKLVDRRTAAEFPHHIMTFYVPNEAGSLRAVGYIHGTQAAEQVYETVGDPVGLRLGSDRLKIETNGKDVAAIKMTVMDGEGRRCPRAEPPVTFSVSGPGQIIGTDAGDLANHVVYPSQSRNAFQGTCYCYVVATSDGVMEVAVSSKGIKGDSIRING